MNIKVSDLLRQSEILKINKDGSINLNNQKVLNKLKLPTLTKKLHYEAYRGFTENLIDLVNNGKDKLKTTRALYLQNVQRNDVNEDLHANNRARIVTSISLNTKNPLVNAIENGGNPGHPYGGGDMRGWMLRGAPLGKNGRYRRIAFDWFKKKAVSRNEMNILPKSVFDENGGLKNNGFFPGVGTTFNSNTGYRHKNLLYNRLMENTKENKAKGSEFSTIRTISENGGNPDSWIQKGIEAHHFFKRAMAIPKGGDKHAIRSYVDSMLKSRAIDLDLNIFK